MPQDPKKRQQALQRRQAKRKQRQREASQMAAIHRAPSLNAARQWPLHEVLLSRTWRDAEDLTQILVSRQGPGGYLAVGAFIVDRGCLGVKTAYGRIIDAHIYAQTKRGMAETQSLIHADLNLVAKIIREALTYARSLGFQPDPDYRLAMLVLGDVDPDACTIEVPPGGKDGKPFYVAGPYDDWQVVLDTLRRAVGPDGFHYLVPLAGPNLPDFLDPDALPELESDEEKDVEDHLEGDDIVYYVGDVVDSNTLPGQTAHDSALQRLFKR